MKQRILIILFAVLTLALSNAALAQTRVACVGDSITAGWKLKESEKYVTKLAGLLGAGYEVENFGHSAYGMLKIHEKSYWDSPMYQAAQDFQPQIVTIMLGTNDAKPEYWPEYEDDYHSDYLAMIAEFQGLPSNPRVIVLGLPYLKPGGLYDGVVAYNKRLPTIADEATVEYIEIWNVLLDSGLSEQRLMKDPIHPSAAAHTIIAETVHPVIVAGSPSCDDGECGPGENACNCPGDCGPVPVPSNETVCDDAFDNDCDGVTDCADSDCDGADVCQGVCDGDGVCEAGEDCINCAADCDRKRTGKPIDRFCCGNGVVEGPENDDDGRCNGNP